MEWINAHWAEIGVILTSIVTAASVIVKLTPTPKDDTILAKIVSVLDILALNKKK